MSALKTAAAAPAPGDAPELLREDADAVATLTLNRPERLNALSEGLIAALQSELDRIAGDRSIRAVVLRGAGRAFCAGHDLREMQAHPDQPWIPGPRGEGRAPAPRTSSAASTTGSGSGRAKGSSPPRTRVGQ